MLCPNPGKRANVEDICVHWWVNFGYEQNPAQLTEACAGHVDRNSLVESLKSGNGSDSDTENPKPLIIGHHHKKQASRPLKGILKKPRETNALVTDEKDNSDSIEPQEVYLYSNGIHQDGDRLKRPRSNCELSSDWLTVNKHYNDQIDFKKQQSLIKAENRKSAPVNCDSTKSVFDSKKKPKKSILKNRSGSSRSDSGCVIDEQMNIYTALENFEVVLPVDSTSSGGSKETNKKRTTSSDSQRDSAYIERKQSCDSEIGSNTDNSIFDLNDIESVLDDIVNFEVATEKRLQAEASNQGYHSNGFVFNNDHSSYQNQSNSGEYVAAPSTSKEYSEYDLLKEPVKYRNKTSTPNRHLRGILKRNSRSKENSWRHSLGSQGSNSSGDILDFSYDSVDGEYFMQEFCAIPIPLNDEEEQAILIHSEEDNNNLAREAPFTEPVQEPWSEFDIMPWQEMDVPLNDSLLRKSYHKSNENIVAAIWPEVDVPLNASLLKSKSKENMVAEVYDNLTEQYDNIPASYCDNLSISNNHNHSHNETVTGNNTHGEECAIIDLKLSELNICDEQQQQQCNENISDINLLVGSLNESVMSSVSSDTPPPLPVRPPPIGAPASPVRYRVTPPPTPPPPLPETPPPPFKTFEMDIFEFDMFGSDLENNKIESADSERREGLSVEILNSDIECIDYDKVFDAIEEQTKNALSMSNSSQGSKLGSSHGKDVLDQKLLAKMQGFFESPEPVVDIFTGRHWTKSHSAQTIPETEKMYGQSMSINRPLSKELDMYNLELWHAIENTKLHISDDDLISLQGTNTSNLEKLVTCVPEYSSGIETCSSSSITEEEIVQNIKRKMLLHIDSVETEESNTTGNESLAQSSHEALDKLQSDMIELFIEEDTMQKNISEPAFNNISVKEAVQLNICNEASKTFQRESYDNVKEGLSETENENTVSTSSSLDRVDSSDTLNNEKMHTTLHVTEPRWFGSNSGSDENSEIVSGNSSSRDTKKDQCVQLSNLVINGSSKTDLSNVIDKTNPNHTDTVFHNVVHDTNGSCELHINEDNLFAAIISNVNNTTSSLPGSKIMDSNSLLFCEEDSSDSNTQDDKSSASNAHYLDDIMKSIDELGEQLDSELHGSSAYSSPISKDKIFIDFEEASEVCRQAVKICENLE